MRKTMLLLVVFGLVGLAWAADDPFIGTWEMDVSKSKAADPSLLPKSEVMKIMAQGNAIKTTFDGVDSQGKSFHAETTGEWNGKDFPVTGDPTSDSISVKRLGANTLAVVNKKAGKEVIAWRCTVSKDGKTLTAEGKFKGEKGKEQSITEVYDKQ